MIVDYRWEIFVCGGNICLIRNFLIVTCDDMSFLEKRLKISLFILSLFKLLHFGFMRHSVSEYILKR